MYQENPYADFERIFSHFASAEELTGTQVDEGEKVEAEEAAEEEEQQPAVRHMHLP